MMAASPSKHGNSHVRASKTRPRSFNVGFSTSTTTRGDDSRRRLAATTRGDDSLFLLLSLSPRRITVISSHYSFFPARLRRCPRGSSVLFDLMDTFAMSSKSVKVSNVSLGASQRDIKEFFSFSGDIEYVEMQSFEERSQIAYVTFKDMQGAETALLLSGATIVDLCVSISLAPDYQLPPDALTPPPEIVNKSPGGGESAFRKTEDVVSSMLAKGFILGKDAVNKAKTFDEKHQLTSTASAKVSSLDKKIGFSEKIGIGTSIINDKAREVDQKFQVSEKTKSAFSAAEQKVSGAGSAIMKNRYVLTGASWVTDAFSKVAKAVGEVGQKTKEKVGMAEEEQKRKMVDDFAQVHLSESPKASSLSSQEPSRPAPAQGLIL